MAILFRALGITSDKQILNKVVYDPEDGGMCEALRPSLEESMMVITEEDALDFIARRGSASQYSKEKRIKWASMILESEFLPHVSTTREGIYRKTYFVGYMVNRLI